jgi:UDP-N-acetylmuramoyl-tripeptide--D-alanyl-D-alanine ligase
LSRLVLWLVAQPVVFRPMLRAAALHRRHTLGRVLFVAVTGSCGKTTTKDLAAAVLAARGRGRKTPESGNELSIVARTILKTLPWHRFAIAEVAAWGPDTLGAAVDLFRPRIGVVTNVGSDHYTAFRTLAATAAEKGRLVEALPPDGTAVLNADDPHVLAMRERCAGRVLTYGLSAGAELRGEDVSSAWPERLSFTVVHGDERLRVRTRLCGAHWAPCALAALAVGVAAGVPLAAGGEALARVESPPGRMSPVELVDGITFIRDDYKAPLWSIPPALEFLRAAQARRKVAVIGTIADFPGNPQKKYARVARHAIEVADYVVFVGRNAHSCLRARRHAGDDALRAFATVREVAEFLQDLLRPGDLVLLKGCRRADHLSRLVLARTSGVGCWREACARGNFCEHCPLLGVPALPSPQS